MMKLLQSRLNNCRWWDRIAGVKEVVSVRLAVVDWWCCYQVCTLQSVNRF